MSDGWQPIETAPNNILLVTNGSYVLVACQNDGRWFSGWECGPVRIRADLEGDDKPTHWMHLPPPPPSVDEFGPAGSNFPDAFEDDAQPEGGMTPGQSPNQPKEK